jgi:PAS domain S-box-containing protein
MDEYFSKLFENKSFMPHGHCYLWQSDILWTHVISDGIIALSYFSIPLCLAFIYRSKKNLQFRWILALFALFIVSCGTTHILNVITVWKPIYRIDGLVKAVTAIASAGTAFFLLKITPIILKIPTRKEMEEANEQLRQQVALLEEKDEELRTQVQLLKERDLVIEQSKEALRESEDRYQSLVNLFDSIIIHVDGKIVYANPSAAALYGVNSHKELIGVSVINFLEPEFRSQAYQRLSALQEGKQAPLTEYTFIRKDGRRVFVELTSVQAVYEGTPAIQSIIRDITSRKEQEIVLKESEAKFRQLFELDLIGIFYWDAYGNILDANNTFFNMTGYTGEDLLTGNLRWNDITATEFVKSDQQALNEVMESGKAKSYEKEMLRKQGDRLPVLAGGALLEGFKDRGVAYMIDISEQKQNQMKLQQSESKFRRMFESDMIGIIFWKLDGELLDANDAFLKIVGYSREELIEKRVDWRKMTPSEYAEQDLQAVTELQQTGIHKPYEKEYVAKPGIKVPILVGGSLLEGYSDRGVSFILDITKQKNSNEALRITLDELKKRNAELDNYVYKVSHDLRSPLTSILGLINIIHMEKDMDTIRKYIGLIENRANKLDHFIQSVLSHSRTLNHEVKAEKIDFDRLIRDSFEELKYLVNWEKVRLIVEVKGKTDFYNDVLRMNILLKNFTSNAIKYINPYAEYHYLRYTIDIAEEQAVLTVEDNGLGIEEEYLGKIFDMFFRATEKSDGSGLGLYIVKQAIETLRGNISVESKPGKGTIFRILLPNRK